jgi:hypothetical protein
METAAYAQREVTQRDRENIAEIRVHSRGLPAHLSGIEIEGIISIRGTRMQSL